MFRKHLFSFSSSPLSFVFHQKRVCFAIKIGLAVVIFLLVSMLIPPLRNAFLYPVWPKSWRHVGTIDLLMMAMLTESPANVVALPKCPIVVMPNISQHDPRLAKIHTSECISVLKLKHEDHRNFLPVMDENDKRSFIQMFLVLAESLSSSGVKFFFESGSLLGAHRHHGLVPWDDDIDIAINVDDWPTVRDALSCIEGYILQVDPIMHWKFYGNSSRYPFIDIFFYTGNDDYIWAITDYTRRNLVARKAEVFPLGYGLFEGIQVPLPKEAELLVRKIFDFDYCVSRSSDHKTGESLSEKTILCSSLSYMYKMFHLDE